MEKEFHIWFSDCPFWRGVNSYEGVMDSLRSPYIEVIHTHNLLFCDMRIITKYGYRLFIHPAVGDVFEVTLGECTNTDRHITEFTNILNLLLSGEFDTEDCKVVEEVL